nr:M1 family metallopeptidase [Deltaproteobacteria bacterium]
MSSLQHQWRSMVAAGALLLLPSLADAQTPPRVADYTFTATLDPVRHTVRADGTIRWTNPSSVAVSELWLHQYLNGFSGPRTYFMRTRSASTWPAHPPHWGRLAIESLRTGDGADLLPTATPDPAVPEDDSQLRVALPRAVAPGATIELAVRFTATLPEMVARTGYQGSFHMVAQWFPKVAVLEPDGTWAHFPFHANSEFYSDFGRYDIRIRYPRGYTIGATGPRVEGPALVDGLMEQRHVLEGIHDFAFTAWNHFRRADRRIQRVEVHVLHPPGNERGAARTLDLLSGALPAFERRFGPYPYPVLTVVLPPPGASAAGGMEYPTLITTGSFWWGPRRARDVEYVTLHEFGHQYFYGMLASSEHRHPFLDEGFCEYATARVMEDLFGRGAPLLDLPMLGPRLDAWSWEALGSSGIAHPLALDLGADQFPTWGRYGEHVYSRAAIVLRTMERRLGTRLFTATLRAYVDRARFSHPTPETFYAVVREQLGPPWEAFARTAFGTPWRYNLAVTGASSAREPDGRWRGYAVVDREGPFDLPVNVVFTDVRGSRSVVRIPNDRVMTIVPYDGSAALRSVSVDPEVTLPLEERRLDNARMADGHHAPTLPLIGRVAYWVAFALGSVGP